MSWFDWATGKVLIVSMQQELEMQGVWLFRWRSYLPFVFVPLVAIAVINSQHDGTRLWSDTVWPIVCLVASLLGLFIRMHCVGHASKGTSGRNTKKQVADDLNTTGMYSIVRHPLYLGNFLIAVGIIAQPNNWWLIGLFTFAFVVYYERIMFAEEAFLHRKFALRFDAWAAHTPAFLPWKWQWIPAQNAMNGGRVVRQEAAAVAVISIGFAAVEIGSHAASGSLSTIEPWWIVFSISGVATYISLRCIKSIHWYQNRLVSTVASTGLSQPISADGIVTLAPAGNR